MRRKHRIYAAALLVSLLGHIGLYWFQRDSSRVETLYSQSVYPVLSSVYGFLLDAVPFSVGDMFYAFCVGALAYGAVLILRDVLRRAWRSLGYRLLLSATLLSWLYLVFLFNWGLNYSRMPLKEYLSLQTDSIAIEQHREVLERYIAETNMLRQGIRVSALNKRTAQVELPQFLSRDTLMSDYLFTDRMRVKGSLNNTVASYFMVGGYFNPFSLEAQVNQKMPMMSYPFTVVHELAHQMGVGFEDECNFIAFLKLKDSGDAWYRYSGYYSATRYLLRSMALVDGEVFQELYNTLAPDVVQDIQAEREFWETYDGWYNSLTTLFYSQYLKANNQPEGMARYSQVSQLILSWEMQSGSVYD